ncbi:MAG: hypothetical protein PVF83_03740 [Anaerolineales bacterium]|jgi:hypothetical protein
MPHFSHGGIAAAHAARQARIRQEQEEEEMTKYTGEDLEQNWEFKIVRAYYPAFRKADVFQSLLAEEALAGWELVEKLDDRRIRFKRRREARRKDATLPPGIDPYRTQYGRNTNTIGVFIGLFSAIFIAGLAIITTLSDSSLNSGNETPWILIATVIPAIVVLLALVILIVIRFRRG